MNTSIHKSGYGAIIGRPNVGKSTLVNALLNFKLSIITPKPQTTRTRVLGILSDQDYQIIFIDTPGLIKPKYRLQEVMVKSANRAVSESDLILFLTEANAETHKDLELLQDIIKTAKPIILAINKIDLVSKSSILAQIDHYSANIKLAAIVPISARHRDGLESLKNEIVKLLPPGPQLYPEDQITEHPERFFVCELIREHIFYNYGKEVPYSTAVILDEFKERSEGKDYIKARIVVERQSHKGIIIGQKGHALKRLGELSRKSVEEFLGRPVFLDLWVTVKPKWRQKDTYLKEYGYQ